MIKNGLTKSIFHHVFSDHEIILQSWICSNKSCRKSCCAGIKAKLGSSMHTDLQKLQIELGSEQSYKKSARILELFSQKKRRINNHQRVSCLIKKVGERIDDLEIKQPHKEVEELVVHVDGGYVHDWNNKGSNYEILVGKIYSLESVMNQSKNRNKIVRKSCFSSAYKGKESKLQERLLNAAKEQGLTEKTTVTALFDGASNCSNAVKCLNGHCSEIQCILDWVHIAKKIKVLENCLLTTTYPILQNRWIPAFAGMTMVYTLPINLQIVFIQQRHVSGTVRKTIYFLNCAPNSPIK